MKKTSCIALFALLLIAGCDKGTTSTKTTLPTVQLYLNWKPESEFGGFYAAQEKGLFKKQGFDVEIVPGSQTISLISAGKIPFGIVSADEIIIARSKGSDVVAIFAGYQTDPHAIMVHKANGYKSLEEVLTGGGTLAIENGNPYTMMLERKYGFGKVKVVPSPKGDVSAFLHDPEFAQQVFISSEPISAKKNGGDPENFMIADTGYNPYSTVVATRKDYVREHPEIVKGFAIACRDGWQSYLDDPKPINAIISNLNPSMDAATLEESVKLLTPLVKTPETATIGIGGMTAERWKTLNQQLVDLKLVDKAQAAEDCFLTMEQLGVK